MPDAKFLAPLEINFVAQLGRGIHLEHNNTRLVAQRLAQDNLVAPRAVADHSQVQSFGRDAPR